MGDTGVFHLFKELFPLFLAFISLVVWLVRLEGKVAAVEKANIETQKDVDSVRTKHELLDGKIVEQLSQVRESLARLEGAMGIKKD